MDQAELQGVLGRLNELPAEDVRAIYKLLDEIERREKQQGCRDDYLAFVREMWPGFIHGRHHRVMADAFRRVAEGELKRLIINMPPRHTKSEFASYLLPAWYLGRFPNRKVIQASHKDELATGFGRKVRNLVGDDRFQAVFPGVTLRADSKAAGRWATNADGEYFSIGVGGSVTGKGADLFIIDDPHDEQDGVQGQHNPEVWNRVWDWYTSGPRQRLQPGAAIVIVMTRWHKRDLTGLLLDQAVRLDNSEWEVIEFPALLENDTQLWPEFWPQAELFALRDQIPKWKWSAQYQQNPVAEGSALVKREWWKRWDKDKPPKCDFVIQSWDTAFRKTERSDYSACTTWGVFFRPGPDGKDQANIMLLDAFKERMEFPELKACALKHWRKWEPEAFVIESKAAGDPLISELRRMGIPVSEYNPTRGNDKISRVNSITDLFSSGLVWCNETRWADMVVEEFAEFPVGEHDDVVDSATMALLRFRQGGFLRLPSDEEDEERKRPRRADYY